MKRELVRKRPDWQARCEDLGFSFHSMDELYWTEGACYSFTSDQIDHIEEVTNELHEMCLKAVEHVIANNLFARMGIDERFGPFIRSAWERNTPSLYGRFDFAYDGKNEPKLLEYNADTPTALFEASIIQWVWLEDLFPEKDQFNSIHERLKEAFAGPIAALCGTSMNKILYFTCVRDHEEDFVTVQYLRDVAMQAGLATSHVFVEDIGFSAGTGRFHDIEGQVMEQCFKLYPWEWLFAEEFGPYLTQGGLCFIEPPWKLILSSKAILAILWEIFPEHPNLLPAFFSPEPLGSTYVRKPFFGREGADVAIIRSGVPQHQGPSANYGAEGFIFQAVCELPAFGFNHPVIGSWVVNGVACGIGIREDDSPITKNTSRFIPHYFHP